MKDCHTRARAPPPAGPVARVYLYVDDILILGTSLDVIKETKDFLSNNFEMKDLGEADVILNIKLRSIEIFPNNWFTHVFS
jgi:hypothetical protein